MEINSGKPVEGMPNCWRKFTSKKTGNPYYFNTETGESRWEKPEKNSLISIKNQSSHAEGSNAYTGKLLTSPDGKSACPKKALPTKVCPTVSDKVNASKSTRSTDGKKRSLDATASPKKKVKRLKKKDSKTTENVSSSNPGRGKNKKVTGHSNIIKQDKKTDEEQMEWEEYSQDLMLDDLKGMRQMMDVCTDAICGPLTKCLVDSPDRLQTGLRGNGVTVYVVIDTNVFLSDAGYVDELKDNKLQGVGFPAIIIPWVVLQELDAIKDNARGSKHRSGSQNLALQRKAKKAVDFVNHWLEAAHPRVIGQQPVSRAKLSSESTCSDFAVECNDDRILQCCIQMKGKFSNCDVVLLTLDKNLRNKGLVMNIGCYTPQTLERWLHQYTVSHVTPSMRTDEFVVASDPKQATCKSAGQTKMVHKYEKQKIPPRVIDEAACELKTELRDLLSIILKDEMNKIYEDQWMDIVYKKPPWTLLNLLDCYEKHWIAVFGFILPRACNGNIQQLRDLVKPGCGFNLSETSLISIVANAKVLVEAFQTHSSYGGHVKKALTAIVKIRSSLKTSAGEMNSQEVVMDVFQYIWEKIHFYTKLFKDKLPSHDEELLKDFVDFKKHTAKIKFAYEKALIFPKNSNNSSLEAYELLVGSLAELCKLMKVDVPSVKGKDMLHFSKTDKNMEILKNGYGQLLEFISAMESIS